ncbi:DUF1643 domain-containing protein [Bacillus massilinigeriensis]|uniref:DUF1643 domain-containing protein n=1 Tax=Bacillus massilionigeriensis TaxID=1805475 RepID=UPI0009FFCF7C
MKKADKIILAWGEKGEFQKRGKQVLLLLKNSLNDKEVYCLNILKGGHPQHP